MAQRLGDDTGRGAWFTNGGVALQLLRGDGADGAARVPVRSRRPAVIVASMAWERYAIERGPVTLMSAQVGRDARRGEPRDRFSW